MITNLKCSNYPVGDIPLRQLVYRVHPLPESMKPLVWDFGSLTSNVERKYSQQIIQRSVRINYFFELFSLS